MLGTLGNIAFSVSENKILSPNDIAFSNSANFAEHKILSGDTLLEFTGFNNRTCSLKIELSSSLGVDVQKELQSLNEMFSSHEPFTFSIGNKIFGQFVIENFSENHNIISPNGNLQSVSISLNLKEFIS